MEDASQRNETAAGNDATGRHPPSTADLFTLLESDRDACARTLYAELMATGRDKLRRFEKFAEDLAEHTGKILTREQAEAIVARHAAMRILLDEADDDLACVIRMRSILKGGAKL